MNEDKFNGKASVYASYRPDYPASFIDYLYSEIGFTTERVIADIGSGTGKLTELLLKKGSVVYGVEPNDDMRGKAEITLQNYSSFKSIKASAEETGLPDNSVDFITVAQAFHWFDRQKFKAECQRILKKSGKVILVWNTRVSDSEIVRENDAVNRKFCPEFKGFTNGRRGDEPEQYADFFKNGVPEYKVFKNDLMFQEEAFIGRNLSGSYGLNESDPSYDNYVQALKELYKKYSSSEGLCMPNVTRSYVGVV